MSDDIRVPPHNDDAERSLLGAILLDNKVLDSILSKIGPKDFYRERHRHIFRAMEDLYDREDASIDVITLGDTLSAEGHLESVGGASYLTRLSNEVPSAANVQHYLQIVNRKSTLREFISKAGGLVEDAYDDVSDVEGFLDQIEADIFELTQSGVTRDYESMREVITDA